MFGVQALAEFPLIIGLLRETLSLASSRSRLIDFPAIRTVLVTKTRVSPRFACTGTTPPKEEGFGFPVRLALVSRPHSAGVLVEVQIRCIVFSDPLPKRSRDPGFF